MVHVIFDGSEVKLQSFYQQQQQQQQSGDGNYFEGMPVKYQRGYGYFAGLPRQRGHGIGDVFKSLWRFLKPIAAGIGPIAKEAGKALGQEGLSTGARVLTQMVEGSNARDAFAAEGQEGVKRLLDRASTRLQRGRGGGRRRTTNLNGIMLKPGDVVTSHSILGRKRPSNKKASTRGKKRQRIDSLGYY